MPTDPPRSPSRLLLTIYLVGVVQFVVAGVAILAAQQMLGDPTRQPWLVQLLPPMAALSCGAVVSFLFAHHLVAPLAQLGAAARAFASGDLRARSGIHRSDEIGAVAKTFDETAERVNALLRAQREFLAGVSHEVRTPLARIGVALDLAAEGDAEAAREALVEIREDSQELERLVASLLVIARLDLANDPEMPAAALGSEEFDGGKVARRAARRFGPLHPGRTLEVDCGEVAIPLCGDPDLLRQVLENLLDNAAKYSDPGAPIHLLARRSASGPEAEFSVVDRGQGIEPADVPRLFEPFFRSDRSRARKTGGVGLGLALAKRVVEAHGGRIRVDSTAGVGTTVAFTIPLSRNLTPAVGPVRAAPGRPE